MNTLNEFHIIIAGASIIVLSYLFNLFARKTNIPSVLMLILLGVIANPILKGMGVTIFEDDKFMLVLKIVGTIGLILIVLEASLDLELRWEK